MCLHSWLFQCFCILKWVHCILSRNYSQQTFLLLLLHSKFLTCLLIEMFTRTQLSSWATLYYVCVHLLNFWWKSDLIRINYTLRVLFTFIFKLILALQIGVLWNKWKSKTVAATMTVPMSWLAIIRKRSKIPFANPYFWFDGRHLGGLSVPFVSISFTEKFGYRTGMLFVAVLFLSCARSDMSILSGICEPSLVSGSSAVSITVENLYQRIGDCPVKFYFDHI